MVHSRDSKRNAADSAQIAAWLCHFVEPGQVAEVRILNAGRAGTVSGYFDDLVKAAAGAAAWSGKTMQGDQAHYLFGIDLHGEFPEKNPCWTILTFNQHGEFPAKNIMYVESHPA